MTSNTDNLIRDLDMAEQYGVSFVRFRVGKNTGNGASVIAALRRRGYTVNRCPGGSYELRRTTITQTA